MTGRSGHSNSMAGGSITSVRLGHVKGLPASIVAT